MRILIHGINFAPELTGIGKYTGEMAAYLAAQGHVVHVVTAPPYYPQWKVAAGYRAWAYRREAWQDTEVYRCPLWTPAQPTGLSRLLHLSSFALSSLPALAGQVAWRPQVVIAVAPALLAAPAAWLAGRLAGARTWLHIQDFELDAAVRLGLLPALKPFMRLLAGNESLFYRRFDRVSTISHRMLQALWRKGLSRQKTVYFPNWVDTQAIHPLPAGGERLPAVAALLPSGCRTIILYSGNISHKQGLEVVVEAAKRLVGQPELQFVLCGEGSTRPRLERQAAGLANVHFIPLQPPERLNELLNAAAIHILPQQAGAADLVMPSKLAGILASGRPVIVTAAPDTELAEVIEGRWSLACQPLAPGSPLGEVIPPGDPARLAEAIQTLSMQPMRQAELGQRGRTFVEQHWDKQQVLAAFSQELEKLV